MTENILIGVAWPFPNGSLHLGQIAGAYLPPDIFARYHRMAGNRVAMVSGTDQHGTPIVVRAEQEGKTPQQVVDFFHSEYVRCWHDLGITFDCYTSTGTPNHIEVAQEFFLKLYEKGDIYKATQELTYCKQEGRFLLDRYVEGTCPNCGYEGARGDQCDNCGKVLDPIELLNPRCRFDGTAPTRRETEHFFLRLSAYNDTVREWLTTGHDYWRRPVMNFSLGVLNEGDGMHDRAITRDLEWGVPIPLEGYDDKRIYVWFENVLGYVSAAKEWAQKQGTPDAWKDFWHDPSAKIYYFIGKDNIWFHVLSWPAMAFMYGGLNQPYDVPANQYLNFGGAKASTSKGTAPFLPDYLERYDPDTIRYYLSAIMPESNDSEFSEEDLIRRNNEELVSTWGNLVNRVLTMTYRNFDGAIPESGVLREQDEALLASGDDALKSVGESLSGARFREALRSAMAYAQEVNRYLNQEEPWKKQKEDPASAARALFTAIGAIESLKVAFYPFVPFSSQRVHAMLGHDDTLQAQGWTVRRPVSGTKLQEPQPLFKKLDVPCARAVSFIDTHAHIQGDEFSDDLDAVIERAHEAGVLQMVLPAVDLATAEAGLALARRYDGLYMTAGYHPHEASLLTPEALAATEALLADERVVAVGEIGLDYYRLHSSVEEQEAALSAQLELAAKHTLPVIIHCRAAWDAAEPLLGGWAKRVASAFAGRPLGVLHYYTYDVETAQRYVERGFLVSIHTSVTHPKASQLREVAATLPLESLVIETDSPYGAPQVRRGRRNEPSYVVEAARQIAEVRGISIEDVAIATSANARRLFRLPEASSTLRAE